MKFIVFCLLLLILSAQTLFSQTDCAGKDILTEKSCPGDGISDQERELFGLVNRYRGQNNLSEIAISDAVCLIANRHVLDLNLNIGYLTHAWSDCEYDLQDSKTFGCMLNAPKKFFPDTTDIGFENVYYTSSRRIDSVAALEAWKKSPLHNSVILNLNQFKATSWKEGCVAVDGKFAALWFIMAEGAAAPEIKNFEIIGLGVTFDEAIRGLTHILSINNVSSTIESEKWVGTSSDKTVVMEMYGTKDDIAEGKMSLRVRLESDNTISSANKQLLQTFLRNLAPDWTSRVQWLNASLPKLKNEPKQTQSIKYKNISAELRTETGGFISLTIKPYTKPVPLEFK